MEENHRWQFVKNFLRNKNNFCYICLFELRVNYCKVILKSLKSQLLSFSSAFSTRFETINT